MTLLKQWSPQDLSDEGSHCKYRTDGDFEGLLFYVIFQAFCNIRTVSEVGSVWRFGAQDTEAGGHF